MFKNIFKRQAALLCAVLVLGNISVKTVPAAETAVSYEAVLSAGGIFADTAFYADTPEDKADIKWQTKINKGIRNGYPTCVTDGKYLYTAAVNKIYKIDRQAGQTLKTAALQGSIAYTYYITYGGGSLFIQLADGRVQAFAADTLSPLWISETPVCGSAGQGLSPIIYDDGLIYASTVVMSKNTGTGSYYCIDTNAAANGKNAFVWEVKALDNAGAGSGFYRAGAAVVGDRLVFGSEGGTLYMVNKYNGEIVDTAQVEGDIRSGCSVYGSEVFFTAKNGCIYAAELTKSGFGDIRYKKFCENSSCDAVIYDKKIYVGGSDGGYTKGVFCVLSADDFSESARFEVLGNVQARPLLVKKSGGIFVYFTCNYTPGKLMCLSDRGEYTLSELFAPEGEYAQYCINSASADPDGNLYYQNDSGCLAALVKPETETVTETTTETTAETTTETTAETTTEAAKPSHSGGGGGSAAVETINITAKIIGDIVHGTAPHTGDIVWAETTKYRLKSGSTAEDAVTRLLEEKGLEYVLHDSGYISSVTSPDGVELSEFSNGANSGWMYTVNGDFPQTAMRNYKLNDGDEVVFLYADDYTVKDKTYRAFSDSIITETATETTTAKTAETVSETAAAEAEESTELTFFDDVEQGIWYFYPVECLHAAGIVNGKDGKNFCPADNVTRAEFAAMLYRAFGDENTYTADFDDTPANAWYSCAVGWARQNGVVYGTDIGHFSPDIPVTRQDAAAMLYRLTDFEQAVPDFADKNDISDYAAGAVGALAQNGIINGNDKAMFLPAANITRAETAVMIFNYLENIL